MRRIVRTTYLGEKLGNTSALGFISDLDGSTPTHSDFAPALPKLRRAGQGKLRGPYQGFAQPLEYTDCRL
jgi:hypothetical protein